MNKTSVLASVTFNIVGNASGTNSKTYSNSLLPVDGLNFDHSKYENYQNVIWKKWSLKYKM